MNTKLITALATLVLAAASTGAASLRAQNPQTKTVSLVSLSDINSHSYVYDSPTAAQVGYCKFISKNGDDYFPFIKTAVVEDNGSKKLVYSYTVQSWDGSAWGETERLSDQVATPKILGGYFEKNGFRFAFPELSSADCYYTGRNDGFYFSKKGSDRKHAIRIDCPADCTIKKITLRSIKPGKQLKWALVNQEFNKILCPAVDGKESGVIEFEVPSPEKGKGYWLLSAISRNLVNRIIVEYEQ